MSNYCKASKSLFIHIPKCAGSSMEYHPFVAGNGHKTIHKFDVPDDVFKWAFVRNPYDRLVSVWRSFLAHKLKKVSCSFRVYVQQLAEDHTTLHELPMNNFVCSEDGEILVDFVGRFETLQEDWTTVCEQLNQKPFPLHQRNSSSRLCKDFYTYYDPETIEIVNELYRSDFVIFDYPMKEFK